MKHIIIQVESVLKYPPTLSLIEILKKIGNDIILCTSCIDESVKKICEDKGVTLEYIGYSYSPKETPARKMVKIPLINGGIRRILYHNYDTNSVIWVMTSITLKYIGNLLYGKKYIMYMYELSQEIRYYPKLSWPTVNLEKLFHEATAVIECEYNRAHIAKAWFGLEKLPYIMPNKPYMERLKPRMDITDSYCKGVINQIADKTIIIYQGIIDKERPLAPFIEAVEQLGNEYALVIMSSDVEKLKAIAGKNTYLLPFVNPPHHLEITSWASIGILTYVPVRGETTSPLNAVYCAPNKIFEYAMFGIPMIGNDIPGLKSALVDNKIGKICDTGNREEIIKTITDINNEYESMSKHSYSFYENIDNLKEVLDIIHSKDLDKNDN